MFGCILGSSHRRAPSTNSGDIATALPHGAFIALLVLSAWATYFAIDPLIPLPNDGVHFLIRGVRAEARNDLVRALALAPALLGCLWLLKSALARQVRPGWILLAASVFSAVRVIEAILILVFAPGTVT